MLDLKPYFDAVNAAKAEVQRVASELDALFREGTDEAKTKALAMQPELDEAQKKQDEAEALYESLKKTNQPNAVAQNFVPVSETPASLEDDESKGVMKRSEFEALHPAARVDFLKSGGKVED